MTQLDNFTVVFDPILGRARAEGKRPETVVGGGTSTSSAPPISTTVATIDTRENILALSPAEPQMAYATDTEELLLWDGSAWRVASIALSEISVGQDQGWTQDNDKRGYGEDYTDGKKHTSMGIGAFNETPYEGAIKVDASQSPITFEIYLRGQWNQIFYDFQMVNGDLEHIPETYVIDVRSGNSNEVGLNGIPIVQEYSVDHGCYPYPTVIDGGTL